MQGKTRYLLGAAAGVLILAGTTISASAADPTPTPGAATCYAAGFGGRWGGAFSALSPAAKLLGLQPGDVAAQRHEGKSLVQIAQTKNVDENSLVDAILADRQAQLEARVKAGTLTQEQADLMLQRMQTQVKAAVERTSVGPMAPAGGAGLQMGPGGRGARW